MIERSALKRMSREQIKGKIGTLFLCGIVMFLITSAIAFTVVGPIIAACGFTVSMCLIFIRVTAWQTPEIRDLFTGFNILGKAIGLNLRIYVFTFLWSLLFFVPGIVKALSYSMANYILAENPYMTASEALEESKRMTRGHLWEIFVLQLSFILWGFLVAITGGLAAIYVMPYMGTTYANYYRELKFAYYGGYNYPDRPAAPMEAPKDDVNTQYYDDRPGNSN